jgi:hypothetical protein
MPRLHDGQEARFATEHHWRMQLEQKVCPQGVVRAWGESGGRKQMGQTMDVSIEEREYLRMSSESGSAAGLSSCISSSELTGTGPWEEEAKSEKEFERARLGKSSVIME